VREGGYRIGVVQSLKAQPISSGEIGAVVKLKLDQSAGPFPADSRVVIRPRSPLALKIVQFERGTSEKEFPDGARIPVVQSEIRTDLDELFDVYDEPTRRGSQENILGYGDALTGRGGDLNTTIMLLPRLFESLEPVMKNLAAPETQLDRFFGELGDFTRIVAPVSEQFARGFADQATTYDAISRDPQALKDTIAKTPATLQDSTESFRVQRPFLRDTALLSQDLNVAAGELRTALPVLNQALEVGTPVTRRSVKLDERLGEAMLALRDLARDPATNGAIRGLTATVTSLNPQLRYLGPYVTVCNYWNIFWTFAAEHFSAPSETGGAQRVLLNNGDRQNDSVSSTLGANEPATGKGLAVPNGIRQYGHTNVMGANAIKEDGTADCTPGQQGYPYGANRHDDTPDKFYRRVAFDQLNHLFEDTPKGPTFDHFDKEGKGVGIGPPRVPKGQTFSDMPEGRAAETEFDAAQRAFRRGQAGR
jgi:ABC-type transporter Mla subunit MlaD